MTFDEWAKQHSFWKSYTKEAFEPVWLMLISAGLKPDQAGDMLDSIVSAMKHEYGE